ncbi:F-box/kelch-repeat protein [Cardamine amara subsp. amara]|uniref:F-box/kelch-repeat protein n=1 Tax=Cardamine amara subsp. amara TaxID=228776 RepID=A0ABD1AEN4_CARAN
MLVSFDFNSEETSMLPAPDIPFFSTDDPIEYCGKVAILDYSHIGKEGMMKLWVMEDADKNVWWSEKTLVLHPSQIHLVNNISLRIQGTTRNGEVIFVPHNITNTRTGDAIVEPQNITLLHIFLYDLQKNLMRKVEINESPYHTKIWDVVGIDDVENLMNF